MTKEQLQNADRIDAHAHVYMDDTGKLDRTLTDQSRRACDILQIDLQVISIPITTDSPTPEEFVRANNAVIEACKIEARFIGFCFVNPGYAREAVQEIRRCVEEEGMAGVKLYHQYRICDPALTPVMETAAELHVPVLMHAGKLNTPEGKARQPRISDTTHFLRAAKMFPETTFIQGHIGGGGDWEWNLRAFQKNPRLYIDTSGSVIDAGIVRRTVETFGPDQVLFATDMSYEESVGKVLDAGLSPEVERKVFAENARSIFMRRISA